MGSKIPELPSGIAMDGGPDNPVGGGNDAGVDGSNDPGASSRTSRVVSMAPSFLVVGDTYKYTPKTSTRTRSLEMVGAPDGMSADQGTVRWTPTAAQAGDHHVTMRAKGDSSAVAEQPINISVVKSTLRAEGDVDDSGGSVHSQRPDAARVLGMGVAVPPRSLARSAHMSVSELDQGPATPNTQGKAVAAQFGPHGQVFDSAAYLTLALPTGVTHSTKRVGVYVYDPVGRWQRTPMVGIDLDNGLVTAKALHFSIYAAIQSSIDTDITLSNAGDKSTCQGALVGRALVSSPLSEIELASVNNLSDSLTALVGSGDVSVQDLLAFPGFTGSLRVVQVLDLVEPHGSTEVLRERKLTVVTLYVPGDGTAKITHSDALGNVLAVKAYPQPALALDDIALRLRGGASDAIFAGDTGQQVGLAARVHLAYFTGDASLEPVSVDDLGMSLVDVGPTYAPLANDSLADVDCDGLLEPYDSTDDSMVTAIAASPSAVTSLFSGDAVTLSARILRGAAGASGTWSLLDTEGATLAPVADAPDSRVFQAASGGRYLVSFRAAGTGAQLEHIFAIDVIERVTASAPPTCNPSKELDTGRVGEAVALTAVVSDDDSPLSALTVEWGLIDSLSATPTLTSASTILVRGDKALFSPLDAGNYTIGCRAFDGMSYGPIGQVDLSVVSREQNRAPDDLVLSPMVTTVPPGGTVVTFHAYARDVDGDTLGFQWDVTNAVVLGEPVTQGGESVLQVQTDASGVVKVQVSVSDDKAPPVVASAVIVVGDPPVTTVDADHDGWPAGTGPAADCNDMDPNIHPGAIDVCGDTVDSDCDGTIDVSDCDFDGYTIERGDCDDADPNRHPGAVELCDGIDNDCNQIVDDGFSVGKSCVVGVGFCQNSGVLQCSADGQYTLCTVSPLLPTQEVCDGVDNDCDGVIDDGVCVSDAGVSDAGVDDAGTGEAGVPDAGVPYDASVMTTVEAGVQQCVYSGPEICDDGLDNDCDGATDSKDIDCQGPVAGDSCESVQTLIPNTYVDGTLDGTTLDFDGACTAKATADVVYSFVMDGNGMVEVGFLGEQPYSWSIWSGTCDDRGSQLVEQFCGTDTTAHDLSQGQYFLVLQGVGGAFKVSVQAIYQ